MKLFYFLATLFINIYSFSVSAEQAILGDKSKIQFTLTQMNVPVEGSFHKISGTATFDRAHPETSAISLNIDLASIDLGNEEGEAEAAKPDWFHLAQYPSANFASTHIKALGDDQYEAHGKLTIKGIASDIIAPFTLKEEGDALLATGKFALQRLSYKLGEGDWADTATLANEVNVHFTVALPLTKP
jgi:polyisoprenoid-binding protein YceI